MSHSVKLSDALVTAARQESSIQSRSLAGQLTHWINIGRAVEKSGSFDYQRIQSVLEADASPDTLSAEEQEVWFARFGEQMTEPSAKEEAFFARRRQLGQGVGLTESGALIYEDAADR